MASVVDKPRIINLDDPVVKEVDDCSERGLVVFEEAVLQCHGASQQSED